MTFKEQLNTKEGEILINTLGSLRQYISFTESGLVVSGCPLKRSPCEQTQRKAGMHSDVPRSGVSIDGNIFSSEVGAFGAVGCCCCCCISEKSSQNQKFFFNVTGATWSTFLQRGTSCFVYAIVVDSSIVRVQSF